MLYLIVGLLAGYYARTVFDYIKKIYMMLKDRFDEHQAGVIRPQVSKVTRSQPISLESETGGILRPSPNQVALDAMMEREKRLKSL